MQINIRQSLVIVSVLTLVGCGSSTPTDYRVIDQNPDEPRLSDVSSGDASGTPADATQVANVAMMSIQQESMRPVLESPVSALAYANRQVQLLVPHKTFRKDRKTGALQLNYDDLNLLTVLNMEPVTEEAVAWMPEWMKSLDGQAVRIRGYMYPTFITEDLERFVLLRDNKECCYGPGAKVYDHIDVIMKEGTTTHYVPLQESLDVVGRFKIRMESAGESIYELYTIEDAKVVPR